MPPIRSTSDYERALRITRGVILAWDPMGLFSGGAPADEFDHQTATLVAASRDFTAPIDSARAISRVFSQSFRDPEFSEQSCSQVGRQLFDALKEACLLPG